MGSANRGGFVLDKGESTEYDFGLGLKMMMMANHQNPNRETAANADFSGDRDISSAGGCSGGGGNFGPVAVDDSDSSSFRSWGGRVFTATQRQELERQTMIYKYMAASIPVPSELLVPMNYKYPSSGRSKDQEPWRCKRTDGKKWRCAKDAAPDHKYCERHCHKTRPKSSRKLVESSPPSLSSSISARRINSNKNNNTLISSSTSSPISNANLNIKSSFPYHETSQAMYMPQQYINSRYPDYFMKREAHHNDQNPPTVSPLFGMDQMTSISTSTDFTSNGQNHSPLPRQFLDAWSSGDSKSIHITGKSVVSDSSLLTLSMAGGAYSEENEEGPAQLGMGLFGTERDDGISIDERYAWMGSLAPGGPLAEALCLGMIGSDGAQGGPPGGLGFMK